MLRGSNAQHLLHPSGNDVVSVLCPSAFEANQPPRHVIPVQTCSQSSPRTLLQPTVCVFS